MTTLLPAIRDWFSAKRQHVAVFANADCRLEGWFKGELLVLFTQLQQRGEIDRFEREVNMPVPGGRLQIDFKLCSAGLEHLCELKALCISRAAGTPRNLQFYFRDDHVGLLKDMRKLDTVQHPSRWLIAFVYPVPQRAAWEAAVDGLPEAFRHWRPLDEPDTSEALFVSLWTPHAAR